MNKGTSVLALVRFDLEVQLCETLPDVPEVGGNLTVVDSKLTCSRSLI